MSNETVDYVYVCLNNDGVTCAEQCVGLDDCNSCGCQVLNQDGGGPWGLFMDFFLGLLPIIVLVYVTIKSNPWQTTASLPFSAFMLFMIRLMYFGSNVILTCGAVVLGLHEALSPISIICGAMLLFETMEVTKCMPYMMREMKALTNGHPVSECMLIFSFAYMVEGASGFGTPVALGAPMLISNGHPKFQAVVVLLIFNTFATVGGAVGTPIWFGFANVATESEFTEISSKAYVCLTFGAFILVPLTLRMLIPWPVIRKSIVFVMLSLGSAVLPALGISFVSYEFPSLIGGMIGCMLTAILISRRIGLAPLDPSDMPDRNPADISTISERHGLVAEYIRSIRSAVGQLDPELVAPLDETSPSQDVMDSPPTPQTMEQTSIDVSEEAALGGNAADREDGVQPMKEEDHQLDPGTPSIDSEIRPKMATESEIRPQTAPVMSEEAFIDHELGPRKPFGAAYVMEVCGRTSPIWGCVVLLILTRIPQIGLRGLLTKNQPYFEIVFNTYGVFRLSASLVFQLINILTFPNLNWRYELLYAPFVIPFVVMSLSTMALYRKDMGETRPREVFSTVFGRLVNPFIALMGALVLVQLLIRMGTEAPADIVGAILADWFKQGFVVICPLLGALGSFFSGSTTVSNLTFGSIQEIAAESIGVSKTSMLALQAVGASAGNGICLNNIIAACTITGLHVGEGEILVKTYKMVFSLTTIATIIMLAFFFRFN